MSSTNRLSEETLHPIGQEITWVLQTIMALDRPYSADYLIRILRADDKFALKKEAHRQLPTWGVLEERTYAYTEDLLHYLLREDYLTVPRPKYATVEITHRGQQFLAQPASIEVPMQDFRKRWYHLELGAALRRIRTEVAQAEHIEPYEVFNNHLIMNLMHSLPTTEAALKAVPGISEVRPAVQAHILEAVQRVAAKKAKDDISGLYTQAYSWGVRQVKDLYEAGLDVEEIARRRKITPGTVTQYLETLHRAGSIDLRPWIETRVDRRDLHKAGEFFRQTRNARLTEAKEVLDLDFDTLRLCRLYVTQAEEPALKYAS
jgi:ATP-dependent DNA helicase RecQ